MSFISRASNNNCAFHLHLFVKKYILVDFISYRDFSGKMIIARRFSERIVGDNNFQLRPYFLVLMPFCLSIRSYSDGTGGQFLTPTIGISHETRRGDARLRCTSKYSSRVRR